MTETYSTDDQIRARYAPADELLFPIDKPGDPAVPTFERHRLVIKQQIDEAMAQRDPPARGVAGEERFAALECLGVLAMAFRENCSTAEDRDRYWALAEKYQGLFESGLENVRAPASGVEEDEDLGSIGGSIPFYRC